MKLMIELTFLCPSMDLMNFFSSSDLKSKAFTVITFGCSSTTCRQSSISICVISSLISQFISILSSSYSTENANYLVLINFKRRRIYFMHKLKKFKFVCLLTVKLRMCAICIIEPTDVRTYHTTTSTQNATTTRWQWNF